ncbi:hypothetical protein CCP4SC76_1620001 [Gammaproteobacteria bacterium]
MVVAPTSLNVPQVKASSITVGSGGEVLINNTGVWVNGEQVLTNAFISGQIAAAVAPKADKTYVDSQDATKADLSYVDTQLALKAGVSYVNTQLATKASSSHNHDGVYDPAGIAQTIMDTHQASLDPHAQYLTQSEGDAAYAALGHVHTWSSLTSKPTTRDGFGLTDVYTSTETDNRINAVVGAAPLALDTLKEIADALGNDANLSATLTAQIATKAAISYVDSQDAALSSAITSAVTPKADKTYVDSRNSGKFEPDWLDSLSVSIIFE